MSYIFVAEVNTSTKDLLPVELSEELFANLSLVDSSDFVSVKRRGGALAEEGGGQELRHVAEGWVGEDDGRPTMRQAERVTTLIREEQQHVRAAAATERSSSCHVEAEVIQGRQQSVGAADGKDARGAEK